MLGAWLVHVGVRGPISFARLRHVLVFAVGGAGVDAGLRVHRGQRCAARRDHRTATPSGSRVQSWWIGDFLGALVVTPLLLTVGFHGFAFERSVRGGRVATYSAFAVLAGVARRGVPAHAMARRLRRSTCPTSSTRCWCGSP